MEENEGLELLLLLLLPLPPPRRVLQKGGIVLMDGIECPILSFVEMDGIVWREPGGATPNQTKTLGCQDR